MEIVGLSKYVMVPVGAVSIWLLVTKGSYRLVERILLGACLLYIGYVISGFLARPDWNAILRSTHVTHFKWDSEYLILSIGIIGTTITPWMQFYLQSSIAEKGIKKEEYRASRLDVIVGCSITDIISFFIIVTCGALLFPQDIRIEDASEAALGLKPLAGDYASTIFALCLANASILGAIIVPLSTAYYVCEAMGWEAGVNKTFKEAPQFMWIYTMTIMQRGTGQFRASPAVERPIRHAATLTAILASRSVAMPRQHQMPRFHGQIPAILTGRQASPATAASVICRRRQQPGHIQVSTALASVTCHDHVTATGNFSDATKHADGIVQAKGDCVGCHDKVQGTAPDQFRNVAGTGGDFTQASRHVFGATVSNFDCIVCHAEGDTTSAGTTIKMTTQHNDAGKTIAMRSVDQQANPGTSFVTPGTFGTWTNNFWQWPKPSVAPRTVVRHILPNSLGPVIVAGTIDVAAAIIAESTLSFLGLGFPPDIPTWGRLLFDAKDHLYVAPHWALFPGMAIFLTVLSINYIGDGLRDAFDPRKVM